MLNIPQFPTIFVQIAAYRDRDLQATIRNIIQKAKYPEKLSFGVCWQHAFEPEPYMWLSDSRFTALTVYWTKSKGCCWARSKTQGMYNGEDLTLQIDSHMRFIENWDVEAVELLRQCEFDKPILSYYPPPFELKGPPGDSKTIVDLSSYTTPQSLTVDRWESGFIPYYGSIPIPLNATKPVLGRFLAAGFIFTIGKWCEEVPYNPNIYFLGEETDLSLRSFTHGYSVFHPHKSVCWHRFIRHGEPRHWEDHSQQNVIKGEISENYVDITNRGWEQLRSLLHDDTPNLGIYGCGKLRSRRDFELFAGINFKHKLLHPNSKYKLPPITTDPFWEDHVAPPQQFNKTLQLNLSNVPILHDYEYWYFGIHNSDGVEIYRKDLKTSDYFVDRKSTVDVNTVLDHTPKTYTLWPYSRSKGWQTKITMPIE